MFKIDLEYITKSKTAVGVEFILLSSGGYEINYVVLKKKKKNVVIEKQVIGIKNIEELSGVIDLKAALIIVLAGKGIIHRKMMITENDTSVTLLNKVLPNANVSEFCIEQNMIDDNSSFVSVIRIEALNLIFEELSRFKIKNINSLLLGPFVMNDVFPLIKWDTNQMNISCYDLEIEGGKIATIAGNSNSGKDKPVLFDNEHIPLNALIAFGAAMSYFTGNFPGVENSENLNHLKEEYKEKQKFEFTGWTLLVAVLLIVSANCLLFNNYWSKSNELRSRLVLDQSTVQHCDTLKKEYTLKKEFLEENGLLENSRTSFYADQLAKNLPASIQWTDVTIHPLKKKNSSDDQQSFFFENKIISISGKCQMSVELNDWMKKIKKEKWIADVSLMNYAQDKETNDGIFSIEIQLK